MANWSSGTSRRGRLSFEALQRRTAAPVRAALGLAGRWSAYFVAFDVLQLDGQELLARPYATRRALWEELFTARALKAPWTWCPMTTDLAKAREWLESRTDVSGVEGVVVKPLNSRYMAGYRGWTEIRPRETTEAIIGAVTATLTRPGLLVLGRYDRQHRLRAVGRTATLRPDVSRQVGVYLWGPVGRGKSWLSDTLFDMVRAEKQRVHFHEFFRGFHTAYARHRHEPRAGERAVAELLGDCRFLFFDEFHVHDAGDAMLMGRVVSGLFERGTTLLATSNYPPSGPFPNLTFHHMFEPTIGLLERSLDIVEIPDGPDYRVSGVSTRPCSGFSGGRYLWPGGTSERADRPRPCRLLARNGPCRWDADTSGPSPYGTT
ncbi:cell division protein ZapE [Streptomyces sp. NPDC032472]|uniref:cell division protein ZapE n=1 Tax=Streptomyces sp. NPDC032472 TaxID=3155018 RepID=UPI0033DBA692